MRPRDPYQMALSALAGFAGEGRFGSGMPLVITALAQELGLSPTPVREALARLAGEGVIEHWPGRGYFAPVLETVDIVELYEYHQRLLLWAIETPAERSLQRPGSEGASVADRLEHVFAWATGRSGNRVLIRAQRLVAARLRPVRAVEATVAAVTADQVDRLERLVEASQCSELRDAVIVYHEGRLDVAASISSAMRRAEESIG